MANSYRFGRKAAQQVQRSVRKSERVNPRQRSRRESVHQLKIYVAKTLSGGIPAMTGDTPGKAAVVLYRFDSNDDLEAIVAGGEYVEPFAYNLSESAVAGDTFIQLKQEVSGRLLVDFENCGS